MGVIFRKEVRVEPLTNAIAGTITSHVQSALAARPPTGPEETREQTLALVQPAAAAAAQVAAQPPTKISIDWKPFLISVGIFFVLLLIAIFVDWRNIVDDPTVYTGMVTTVLGIVVGFLGETLPELPRPNRRWVGPRSQPTGALWDVVTKRVAGR